MRALVCVACHCELERLDIAGGRAVVICIACRTTGDEQHFMDGARLAEMAQEPRRAVTPPPLRRAGSGRRSASR